MYLRKSRPAFWSRATLTGLLFLAIQVSSHAQGPIGLARALAAQQAKQKELTPAPPPPPPPPPPTYPLKLISVQQEVIQTGETVVIKTLYNCGGPGNDCPDMAACFATKGGKTTK